MENTPSSILNITWNLTPEQGIDDKIYTLE